MAFDYKKEYKEFYLPKAVPTVVDVPSMNYIAISGCGNPNEADGEYQRALGILYPVAYTLKMSYKTDYRMDGFFEYVVPPLESLWWIDKDGSNDFTDKSAFKWIAMIRLPDFVKSKDAEWAKDEVRRKKGIDCSSLDFFNLQEGLCVQIMHIGPYDAEPVS
ncbi:MAG: GyrI-like domain-containing protein, partial [Prevotella sp.]|nr:GyrI-like domain-containing protein [Prevotella sp.]